MHLFEIEFCFIFEFFAASETGLLGYALYSLKTYIIWVLSVALELSMAKNVLMSRNVLICISFLSLSKYLMINFDKERCPIG